MNIHKKTLAARTRAFLAWHGVLTPASLKLWRYLRAQTTVTPKKIQADTGIPQDTLVPLLRNYTAAGMLQRLCHGRYKVKRTEKDMTIETRWKGL